jgi:hypothetical protein
MLLMNTCVMLLMKTLGDVVDEYLRDADEDLRNVVDEYLRDADEDLRDVR